MYRIGDQPRGICRSLSIYPGVRVGFSGGEDAVKGAEVVNSTVSCSAPRDYGVYKRSRTTEGKGFSAFDQLQIRLRQMVKVSLIHRNGAPYATTDVQRGHSRRGAPLVGTKMHY